MSDDTPWQTRSGISDCVKLSVAKVAPLDESVVDKLISEEKEPENGSTEVSA